MACSAGTLFRIHNSGKVDAFGKNQYGQIGDGTLNDYDKLQRGIGVENVAQISGGDTHTLFKANDGIAYSCGNNDYGQLGIGTRNHSKSPQKIWGLEQVKQVVAGPDYSAAILASGAVLTWGNNEFGQLGDEVSKFKELPKRVKDVSKVKQISLSSTHATCVLHDGTVVSWGDNSHGQLGTGFKGKATPPTVSNITGAFYAANGKNFTIIVLDTGKVKCFGHNNNGQLGMDSETDVMFAKEIPGLKSIVKVVASESFAVAMSDIGEVFTWGRYSSKEGETYYKPQKIEGLKYVKDIGVTTNRGFALLEDGSIVKWNGNIDFVEKVETRSIAE
nr:MULTISPECIES: hypothetical protein [unclassified Fusibacter]